MASIDEEIKSKFGNNRHRLITNLVFTAGWIRNLSENMLRPYGLSTQQYNILRILRGFGNWMPMTEVKARMVEKAPNATRLADKLLKKGWIERKRSETDRRVVYVQISKEGLELMTRVGSHPEKGEIYQGMERITEEEALLFSEMLDRFRG